MPILSDGILYSVVRQEHLPHSDFFLRWLSFPEEPQQLTFTCLSGGRELCRVSYGSAEIAARLAYGREEIHVSGGIYLIKIAGQDLELRAMTGIELLITGKISQITLA